MAAAQAATSATEATAAGQEPLADTRSSAAVEADVAEALEQGAASWLAQEKAGSPQGEDDETYDQPGMEVSAQ